MQSKPQTLFLFAIVIVSLVTVSGCDKLRARDKLNKGVQAYKGGQTDQAIEDFKEATQFDPDLLNARLYLATAYSAQYIPGAPSPENIRNGDQAKAEFMKILETHPDNLSAIDGIGSILYNMGGTPFDAAKMEESKSYHQKHIAQKPDDPEPYYWIGVIDWSLAFRGNREMREEYNKGANKPVKNAEPMPPALAAEFQRKYGAIVDEGMTNMKKAIDRRQDYSDAMAYLNLLYRQKADMDVDPTERENDIRIADDLVDQAKAIMAKNKNSSQSPQ